MRRTLAAAVALALLVSPTASGWTWPLDGPILRPFSFGADPHAGGQHRGLDVGGAVGTTVYAPASGTVSFVGSVPNGGHALTVQTSDGYAVTLLQLGSIALVRGAVVAEGQPVGVVGTSADATTREAHVHLGIRRAVEPDGYLDPLDFLPARPATPVPVTVPSAPQPVKVDAPAAPSAPATAAAPAIVVEPPVSEPSLAGNSGELPQAETPASPVATPAPALPLTIEGAVDKPTARAVATVVDRGRRRRRRGGAQRGDQHCDRRCAEAAPRSSSATTAARSTASAPGRHGSGAGDLKRTTRARWSARDSRTARSKHWRASGRFRFRRSRCADRG